MRLENVTHNQKNNEAKEQINKNWAYELLAPQAV